LFPDSGHLDYAAPLIRAPNPGVGSCTVGQLQRGREGPPGPAQAQPYEAETEGVSIEGQAPAEAGACRTATRISSRRRQGPHEIASLEGEPVEGFTGDASLPVSKSDSRLLGAEMYEQVRETIVVCVLWMRTILVG
jgi:hypothetical protein